MKLFSYLQNGAPSIGVVDGTDSSIYADIGEYLSDAPRDMSALLGSPTALSELARMVAAGQVQKREALSEVHFLPLIPSPGKIVCMGLNYAEHAREGGNPIPGYPALFLRAASSQVAHGQPLVKPRVSEQLDFEAELAVVIGRQARYLTQANALDCVAGYSLYNDASVRDYQRKSTQWTAGKNFDGTGAFGPWLVTPDELPRGAAGLRIRSVLNGTTMQDGNTSDFIWNVEQTLVLLSECMTLNPGDVVITGTPAGVGYARKPPVFMCPGDVCEIIIEGIGTLSNPVVAAS
ncbi:MAG TPA: fumarylacetoacetate hydrolase family protein [Acidovorax sp.]|nr:fumarylacetoacetate hydrolase family protein [Acidovorax sp.]